ncbi:MAG: GTPase [Thermofilum sp.]
MFRDMRLAPRAAELFEVAARSCRSAAQAGSRERVKEVKRRQARCVRIAAKTVRSTLREVYTSSPYVEKLHPFYRELCRLSFDLNEYKVCLARLRSAERIVSRIAAESLRELKGVETAKDAIRVRRSFFGRLGSLLESLEDCLIMLRQAQLSMLKLPEINPDLAAVIIAGAPNVGKSSLLRALTRAKPEVQPYPFTTRNIILGVMEHGVYRVQLVDTPGLLDSPLEDKSRIEQQAVLALRYLGDAAIFVADPTETCGFTLDFQRRVYEQVTGIFPEGSVIVAVNKLDIAQEEHLHRFEMVFPGVEYLPISAEKRINLDKLADLLTEILKKSGKESKMLTS